MQYPVLTERMLLPGLEPRESTAGIRHVSGLNSAICLRANRRRAYALAPYALAMRCPVLTQRITRPTRLCLAHSTRNTCAIRCQVLTERMVLPAYARAMRCPVLT
eukprot:1115362-Rhodomonas_salina.5